MHRWSENDDIVAFYLYKYGTTEQIESAAKKLGIKDSSLKMRISNFAFLDNKKGLSNYSKQSLKIYSIWNENLQLENKYKSIISEM